MARIDHTACSHPRTPAGRRACRAQGEAWLAAMRGEVIEVTQADLDAQYAARVASANKVRATADLVRMPDAERTPTGGPVAPKAPRRTARVRRTTPARVAASTCVQAALHVGGGRCACGWSA